MLRYRCQLHETYAALLSGNQAIKSFSYRTAVVQWQNGYTRTKHTHRCSFKVEYRDGLIEHVEVASLSKQQCQKHKLEKLLGENYRDNLPESANMFSNGFRRVWDADHLKLVLV